jgi:hypothetical protein
MRAGASSQPSHFASSRPVQTDASRAQIAQCQPHQSKLRQREVLEGDPRAEGAFRGDFVVERADGNRAEDAIDRDAVALLDRHLAHRQCVGEAHMAGDGGIAEEPAGEA